MGVVMKETLAELKGRADGRVVSRIAAEELARPS
jgi:Glu-tRNA(Gln) amidotransferase subunit E-like FAD-binding protein